MNVNNDLQGLQQLLSAQDVAKPQAGATSQSAAGQVKGDEATLSPAASLAAQVAPDSDVRMEKVAQVQQALAAGNYNVPSSEVAGRIIDHMLGK